LTNSGGIHGMADLHWLTARPIAHRGLHDAEAGVIENTQSAILAAVVAGYSIEVDLQVTADGDAVVHHDDVLGRVTDGHGRIDAFTATELRRVPFRSTADRMLTLGELCDLVAARATLVLELKSRFDGDPRLVSRVGAVLARYAGPAAVMSFDPRQIALLRSLAPILPRGMVAQRRRRAERPDSDRSRGIDHLRRAAAARPQFIAYAVNDLPAAAPLLLRHMLRLPLLAWTVRNETQRQLARRWADQMIFEGFRP
jgi:glycerophosphoryl diester phosphodiesterase